MLKSKELQLRMLQQLKMLSQSPAFPFLKELVNEGLEKDRRDLEQVTDMPMLYRLQGQIGAMKGLQGTFERLDELIARLNYMPDNSDSEPGMEETPNG